jgi:transcriptional regulator with XRE-family HTH domain
MSKPRVRNPLVHRGCLGDLLHNTRFTHQLRLEDVRASLKLHSYIVSIALISKWEAGGKDPDPEKLSIIAVAYGVPLLEMQFAYVQTGVLRELNKRMKRVGLGSYSTKAAAQ